MKTFKVGAYPANPCAMYVLVKEPGAIDTVITKNLGDYAVPDNDILLMPFTSFVDENNLDRLYVKELIDEGIMEPIMRWGQPSVIQSGFVKYRQFEFNQKKLMESDPEGCNAYIAAWKKHYEELYPSYDEEEEPA